MSVEDFALFQVTVLGSGTSQGVPLIGCACPVCRSDDPRDRRMRSSIYVEADEISLLVDTTPELRLQCVREGISAVTGVLFTHAHADHIFGFDDLRRFCEMTGEVMPIYGSAETLGLLQRLYPYAFHAKIRVKTYVRACSRIVTETFTIGPLQITPLLVPHGSVTTYGYLFERAGRKLLAYISDCQAVPDAVRERIAGVEVFFIDGLRDEPHPTHLTSREAVAVGQAVGAGRTYLTHLTHHKSHARREAELPNGCFAAYDGLKIRL